MSSETITRNDLEAIINNVFPPSETDPVFNSWKSAPFYKITSATYINNESIASGGVKDSSMQVTLSGGYYPIGVVGWDSSTRFIVSSGLTLEDRDVGSCTLSYIVYNPNSSARTGTLTASILWMKV